MDRNKGLGDGSTSIYPQIQSENEKLVSQPSMNPALQEPLKYTLQEPGYAPAGPGYAPAGLGYAPAGPGYAPETFALLPPTPQYDVTLSEPHQTADLVGSFAFECRCPVCHEMIRSKITRSCTARTCLASLLTGVLCAFVCFLVYLYAEAEYPRAHIAFIYFPLIAAIFLLLCFVPIICIPFCWPDCKDTTHTCPKCNAWLGTNKFRGRIFPGITRIC